MFNSFVVLDCLHAQYQIDAARAKVREMNPLQIEQLVAGFPKTVVLKYRSDPLGLEKDKDVSFADKHKYYLAIASAERIVNESGLDYLLSIYGLDKK